MIISILNWELLYGIDYSEKWAEIVKISQEEFNKIQSWLARYDIESKKVKDIKIPNLTKEEKIEKNREIKEQEEEQEKAIKSDLIVAKYTITDQINHIRRILQTLSEDQELQDMGKFIDGILKSDMSEKKVEEPLETKE